MVRERQEPTPEERGRLMHLWTETSHRQLEVPEEELFVVQHVQIEVPAYAPIFASVRCAVCGENVVEMRARVKDGQPVCIACASLEQGQLDRAGISTASWGVGLTA